MSTLSRLTLVLATTAGLAGCANGAAGLSRAWGYPLDVETRTASAPDPAPPQASTTVRTTSLEAITADPFADSAATP